MRMSKSVGHDWREVFLYFSVLKNNILYLRNVSPKGRGDEAKIGYPILSDGQGPHTFVQNNVWVFPVISTSSMMEKNANGPGNYNFFFSFSNFVIQYILCSFELDPYSKHF